ncbi:WD40 repeat domain-containing protein [Trinickia diaoshuihuensis]|uniref:WD40 repeat domain-containing protein n=1 Tax=Trinickia diaoshuihuensis TaxID=2292265 RepID=UPI0013C2C975|nr:WD40 repeat domain-containing protein [Trinickia diaoshuihuensis]
MTNATAANAGNPPEPKLERTISLGHAPLLGLGTLAGKFAPIVKKMSFSPDGRFLGLVVTTSESPTDIVVWDVKANKEQARIHFDQVYANMPWEKLLWLQGGKIVTFGAQWQWDAMTGKALPDNPATGGMARLNKDGTKMLTVSGTIGDPSMIHVYDTRTWAERKIDLEGLQVGGAVWTADDKILALVSETADSRGKVANGHHVKPYDTAIRLIDPTGGAPTRDVWFAGEKTGDPTMPLKTALPVETDMEPSFATNQVFLYSGEVIDSSTLAVRPFWDEDTGGITVSPDGHWLFSKGMTSVDPKLKPVLNAVVDTTTGKAITHFTGGMEHLGGIAASPDGKWLAIGDENAVYLYRLN